MSKPGYENYEFDLARSLGVVFEMEDGSCDFVVLNLASTGSVGTDSEHYPAKQVYHDLEKLLMLYFYNRQKK